MKLNQIQKALAPALILLTLAVSNLAAQQGNTRPQQPGNQVRPMQPNGGQPNGNQPKSPPAKEVPQEKETKLQRPVGAPMVVLPRTPEEQELDKLLIEWEAKSSQIKTLQGKHSRIVYNLVFEIEKYSDGIFFLEMPDKGRIDFVSVDQKQLYESKRIGKSGRPFRVESGQAEKWICDGLSISAVNDEEKTYRVTEIPDTEQGKNIINTPLPFLFGMKRSDMLRRYKMIVGQTKDPNKVMIKARPLQIQDLQVYTEAWIILDRSTFIPTNVKLFDGESGLETVYAFTDVKINKERGLLQKIFTEKDPYHPDLKGYKRFIEQVAENPPPAQPLPRPNGNGSAPLAPKTQPTPKVQPTSGSGAKMK